MITDHEIEDMLYQMPYPFENHLNGLWVLHDEEDQIDNIMVHHESPLLTVRVKVMDVPSENKEAFFEDLLKLNASELVHGAYGIEDESIVITDTIRSENLDLNEIQASIDAVILALTTHYASLAKYRKK